jgi:hypothetical protein
MENAELKAKELAALLQGMTLSDAEMALSLAKIIITNKAVVS